MLFIIMINIRVDKYHKCKHIKRILPWTNLRETNCFWCEWEIIKKKYDPPITPPSSPRLRIIN
jgi:hypothetical protein